jgi:ferric-dicitrate binding protein FerR (iron transport regulator)
MDGNSIKAEELAHYLSGESSESEKARVKVWKNRTPENRQKFEEFKRIWKTSALHVNKSGNMFDTKKDWELLSSRIDAEEAKSVSHLPDYTDGDLPRNRGWQTLMRAAAIFLIAGLIGFFAYQNWEPAEQIAKEPALREITTDIAQRANLTLSDGTKVLLNAGSKMKLPKVFNDDKREVFLEGQAYFNVAKNPDKPFVIHSGDAQTRVLGTSFSVSAYPTDEQITIAVKEGRVSFQAGNDTNLKVALVNGQEFA